MNTISTSLARTVVTAVAAAATAGATLTCAGANPPAFPQDWVTVADTIIIAKDCKGGGCPPQRLTFTAKEGAVWVDFTVTDSFGCGENPRVQASIDGKPIYLNGQEVISAGSHALVLNSRCSAPELAPPPIDWSAHVVVWNFVDGPVNTGPGQGPTAPAAHTVTGDVDLYDKPGGDGKKIGMLKQGDSVTLNGPCPIQSQDENNGWCLVTDTTQNQTGAVWGDFISK